MEKVRWFFWLDCMEEFDNLGPYTMFSDFKAFIHSSKSKMIWEKVGKTTLEKNLCF